MRDRVKVFGIDIITGSTRSRTVAPKYALVTVVDGKITSEESVSLFRLMRLVHRHRPDSRLAALILVSGRFR